MYNQTSPLNNFLTKYPLKLYPNPSAPVPNPNAPLRPPLPYVPPSDLPPHSNARSQVETPPPSNILLIQNF